MPSRYSMTLRRKDDRLKSSQVKSGAKVLPEPVPETVAPQGTTGVDWRVFPEPGIHTGRRRNHGEVRSDTDGRVTRENEHLTPGAAAGHAPIIAAHALLRYDAPLTASTPGFGWLPDHDNESGPVIHSLPRRRGPLPQASHLALRPGPAHATGESTHASESICRNLSPQRTQLAQ